MKKTILLTTALFFIFGGWGYGQGHETFDNLTLSGASYSAGSFIGEDGIEWFYSDARGDQLVNGKSLTLRNNTTSNLQSDSLKGGIGSLQFSYKQAFSNNVNLNVYINDVLVANVKSSSEQGATKYSGIIDIDYNGKFVIRFQNETGGNQVAIDDIIWTAYGETPEPRIVADGSTLGILTYVDGEGPSDEQSFKVSGTNLEGNIKIENEAGSAFEVSEDTGVNFDDDSEIILTEDDGEVDETPIYVRLKEGLAIGTYKDTLVISSDDADTVRIALLGEVKEKIDMLTEYDVREGFDNLDLTGSAYKSGTFVGSKNIIWNYTEARGDGTIDGKALMIGRNRTPQSVLISNTIPGGIKKLQFKFQQAFGTDVNLQVWVNDDVVYTATTNSEIEEIKISPIIDVDVEGDFVLKFINTNNSDGQVNIDDITWTWYEPFYMLAIEGTEGWRMLSSPTSDNTYKDLLAGIWTQGMTNSDSPDFGEPNVQYYDISSDSFKALSSLNTSLIPGSGFVAYVYKNEEWDESANSFKDTGTFPKSLVLYGTENAAPLDFSGRLNTSENEWTLAGNPFASPIEWDKLDKSGLTGVVYVYDHNYSDNIAEGDVEETKAGGAYRTWNGSAGSLTDGKIAAFQGFWVNNTEDLEEAHMLVFTESSKTAEGIYYKEAAPEKASFKLTAEIDGLRSSAYYSFNEHGKTGRDKYDALKLAPLDFTDYLSLSIPVEDTPMDINNLPAKLEETIEFPLSVEYYKAAEDGYTTGSGEVTLSASDFQNIPRSWGITLNNYDTGETIDLRETELYTFVLPAAKNKEVVKQRALLTALSLLSEPVREKTAGADFLSITITPGGDTTVQTEPEEKPAVFALEQNYPNPFNPATTIKYSVPRQGAVTLTIYNVMGQKITELVNGEKAPGHYSVSWNAARMASGVYFYRLTAGGQTLIRQMMLIK